MTSSIHLLCRYCKAEKITAIRMKLDITTEEDIAEIKQSSIDLKDIDIDLNDETKAGDIYNAIEENIFAHETWLSRIIAITISSNLLVVESYEYPKRYYHTFGENEVMQYIHADIASSIDAKAYVTFITNGKQLSALGYADHDKGYDINTYRFKVKDSKSLNRMEDIFNLITSLKMIQNTLS